MRHASLGTGPGSSACLHDATSTSSPSPLPWRRFRQRHPRRRLRPPPPRHRRAGARKTSPRCAPSSTAPTASWRPGRHYTVEAGTRILAAGGNAFDAGIACVFAASVNEISHFGLGGEAPAIVFEAGSGQGHRHQRPGHCAEGRDAGVFPRRRGDSRQRSERWHGAGRRRCNGAGAAEFRHDVTRAGDGACHPARRRVSHVRRAASLAHFQPRRNGAVGMGAPHLLSRRACSRSRRDVPTAESRRDAACHRGRRARRARQWRHARGGHRSRTRCVLQGRRGPAHRRRGAGRWRTAQLTRIWPRIAAGWRRPSRRGSRATTSTRPASGVRGLHCCSRSTFSTPRASRECVMAASSICTRSSRRSSLRSTIAMPGSAIRCLRRFPPKACCHEVMRWSVRR